MTYYADAPLIDPATGELVLAGSVPALGDPGEQIVLLEISTELGSNACDPDDGVDYGPAQKATPDVTVRMHDKITRALARLTDRGLVRNVRVAVETEGAQLRYQVDFVDPRSGERRTVGVVR